jgi:hypothetical protein
MPNEAQRKAARLDLLASAGWINRASRITLRQGVNSRLAYPKMVD